MEYHYFKPLILFQKNATEKGHIETLILQHPPPEKTHVPKPFLGESFSHISPI